MSTQLATRPTHIYRGSDHYCDRCGLPRGNWRHRPPEDFGPGHRTAVAMVRAKWRIRRGGAA